MLRDPDLDGGGHDDTGFVAESRRDDIGADGIGTDQPVGAMLLGRTHGHDDAGPRLQIAFHFLPCRKVKLHDVPRSLRRNTSATHGCGTTPPTEFLILGRL